MKKAPDCSVVQLSTTLYHRSTRSVFIVQRWRNGEFYQIQMFAAVLGKPPDPGYSAVQIPIKSSGLLTPHDAMPVPSNPALMNFDQALKNYDFQVQSRLDSGFVEGPSIQINTSGNMFPNEDAFKFICPVLDSWSEYMASRSLGCH